MSVVTCRTVGCSNQNIGISMTLWIPDPDTGEPIYADAVICGECKQPITDVEEEQDA